MSRYVLITAARNESRHIASTIRSVLEQTILPERWIIVSDGSTDGTDDIVRGFQRLHPFITLLRLEASASRSFASQAHGLNHAARALADEPWDFIGCLDADISLPRVYYDTVLDVFAAEPGLGVVGGAIHERGPGGFRPRPGNSPLHVAGAIQMFRRSCFQAIGPFVPLPNGGLDTVAELRADMMGFRVASIPWLPVYHHRPTGGGDRPLVAAFKAGLMDYEIGYHPLYEVAVCARRATWGVPILGSLARLAAYVGARLAGRPPLVGQDVAAHLRATQKRRMLHLVLPFRAALAFLLLLGAAGFLPAAEYFVDYSSGSDLNPGITAGRAWQHAPGDPAAHALPAVAVLRPGDTVRFRGGVEYRGRIRISASGAADRMIHYSGSSWGPSRAVLDGGGTQDGGFIVDASFVRIEGFEIRDMAAFGIWHDSPQTISGVQIVGNRIHDIGPWPSASQPPSGSAVYLRFAQDLLIEGNEHYNTSGDACRILDSFAVTIRDNHFHDGQIDGIIGGGNGLLVIDGNSIHGFGNVVTHGDGMQIMHGDIVRVSNNLLYDNTQNIYIDTYVGGFAACLVYNNVVWNTAPGTGGLSGYYNGIVVDNRFHPIDSIMVYGNTFVDLNNGSGGFRNMGTAGGGLPIGALSVFNNVFFNSVNQVDSSAITTLAMDFNDYYNERRSAPLPGGLSLSDYRSAHPGQERHSIAEDPLLDASGGWSLRPGSPAIDRGTTLAGSFGVEFATDRNGGRRPTGLGWDMGAYEHAAAALPPGKPSGLRIVH